MKRYLFVISILVLLLASGGLAVGSAPKPGPPKPRTLLGDQTGARFSAVAAGAGTRNATITREYTELPVPCRLYDSRTTSRFSPSTFRTIPLTKCPAIPSYATSLTTQLTVISPVKRGSMRIWANGKPETAQYTLQYGTSNQTTGSNVQMSSSGLRVHAVGGPVHLVIDVAGYWSEPIYADVLTASTTSFADVYSSTGMISGYSSALASPGQIVVSVRRDITYCDIQATAENSGYIATAVLTNGNSYLVRVTDSNGTPVRAYASTVVNC